MRSKLFRTLFTFFLVLVLVLGRSPATVASSLNPKTMAACAANPVCAAELAPKAKGVFKARRAFTAVRAVNVKVRDTATTSIVRSTAQNVPSVATTSGGGSAFPLIGAAGLAAGTLAVTTMTPDEVEQARQDAIDVYCSGSNPPSVCGTSQYSIDIDGHVFWNPSNQVPYQDSISITAEQYANGVLEDYSSPNWGAPYSYVVRYRLDGNDLFAGKNFNGNTTTVEKKDNRVNELPWEDWPDSDRNQAIDDLYQQKGDDGVVNDYFSSEPINETASPGQEIEVDTDQNITGDPDPDPDSPTGDNPNGGTNIRIRIGITILNFPAPPTPPDGGGGGGGGDGGGDGDGDGDSDDDSCDTCLDLPAPDPIQPTEFNRPNFFQYAIDTFSNKFPFDLFGTPPDALSAPECPTYTFYGHAFQLCIISDIFGILKIPTIIAYAVYSFHSL